MNTEALPRIPDTIMKNLGRTQRIIDAYKQAKLNLQERHIEGEPSREQVAELAGASMRDVQPVINVYRSMESLKKEYSNIPDIIKLQLLSSMDQFFDGIYQQYETLNEKANSTFKEQADELSRTMDSLERKVDDLEILVLERDSEISGLREHINTLKDTEANLRRDYEHLDRVKYPQAVRETREKQVEIDQLLAKLQDQEKRNAEASAKAESNYQLQRQELIQQHDKETARLQVQLGNERGEWKRERDDWKQERVGLVESMNTVREECVALKTELHDQKGTCAQQKLWLAERDQTIADLQRQIQSAAGLAATVEQQAHRIRQQEQEIERLREQKNSEANDQLTQLLERINNLQELKSDNQKN